MSSRITAIDSLRGLMIIIMILGHTRNFFAPLSFDPIELGQGSISLYLTRVMTNLCAPIFCFLSGMSIFFLVRTYPDKSLASKDLLKRGLILLLINMLFIPVAWFWTWSPYTLIFGVIWVLGLSMVSLSFLIRLPIQCSAAIALTVILGHHVLDYFFNINYEQTFISFILMLLHGGVKFSEVNPSLNIYLAYPIIPWFAVMLLGYVVAHYCLATTTPLKRQQLMLWLGMSFLILFILLRTVIGYGDFINWSWQDNDKIYALLHLFKLTKYPPSLQYLCLALGVGCLLLVLFDKGLPRLGKYLLVFGQASLFLYVVHLPLITASAMLWHKISFEQPVAYPDKMIIPLSWIYLIWLAFIPLFYYLCKWYRPIKVKYKHTLLKYI